MFSVTRISALEVKLKQADKSLVGNKGYGKYLQTLSERFMIDEEKMGEYFE